MSNGYPPPQQPGPQQPPQWGQPPQQPAQGWGQQPGPGWGGQPPVPKKTNVGLIVGLGCGGVLLLVLICAVVGAVVMDGDDKGESGSSSGTVSASPSASGKGSAGEKDAAKGPEGDVTIKACEVNSATTWPAADVEIVNHSSTEANYIVSVEFLDAAGTRLGEGMAATNNLAPGQKAREKAQGLAETTGKISCKISKVQRYPSG